MSEDGRDHTGRQAGLMSEPEATRRTRAVGRDVPAFTEATVIGESPVERTAAYPAAVRSTGEVPITSASVREITSRP